jgi:DNA polymerase III psi subunit
MLAERKRSALLQAMGVDVYRLRSIAARTPAATPDASAVNANVIVVCPRDADARLARFKTQLPHALGVAAERLHWSDGVHAHALAQAAYVAIGAAAARALGVQLSTMPQNGHMIVTTAEPAALLRDGAAKRALWQALKPVARRLRGSAE